MKRLLIIAVTSILLLGFGLPAFGQREKGDAPGGGTSGGGGGGSGGGHRDATDRPGGGRGDRSDKEKADKPDKPDKPPKDK